VPEMKDPLLELIEKSEDSLRRILEVYLDIPREEIAIIKGQLQSFEERGIKSPYIQKLRQDIEEYEAITGLFKEKERTTVGGRIYADFMPIIDTAKEELYKRELDKKIRELEEELKKKDEKINELTQASRQMLESLLKLPVSNEAYEKKPEKPYEIIDVNEIEKCLNELKDYTTFGFPIKDGKMTLAIPIEHIERTISQLDSTVKNSQFLYLRMLTENILPILPNLKDNPEHLFNLLKDFIQKGTLQTDYYRSRMKRKEALAHI
jgi:hypothetical protein